MPYINFFFTDHNYPWLVIGTNETIRNRLVNWLHLPDYIVTLEVYPSVGEFYLETITIGEKSKMLQRCAPDLLLKIDPIKKVIVKGYSSNFFAQAWGFGYPSHKRMEI